MARFGRRMPQRALAGALIVLALGAGTSFVVSRDGGEDARRADLTRAVQGTGDGALRSLQDRGQAVSDRAPARLAALYADAADAAAGEREALDRLEVPPALRADVRRLARALTEQEAALRALAGGAAATPAVERLERATSDIAALRGRLTHRLRTAA
jgi:hypothetical protein